MRLAINKAVQGIRKGQTPFGACIVKGNRVISLAHNSVWRDTDITAHAEINAVRKACKKLKTIDLSGCVIYSTCEPCPMCFAACHWAGISAIIFGARIADARRSG
ncbi:MAG: nucleoside deaminase, partial [Candidatus Omnitrophica bacterium]|nr:nucleoside deaminase [Candidatus Omnitrophota bacterium]